MSHEHDSQLIQEVLAYLKDPATYEEGLKEKKAITLYLLGQELPNWDYMKLKHWEARMIQALTYIKEQDRKPLDVYVDCINQDQKGFYLGNPQPHDETQERYPSFVSYTYYHKPDETNLSKSLGFPVQSKFEIGLHLDSQTKEYFASHPAEDTFGYKTTYIVRKEAPRVVKLVTLPAHLNDERDSFPAEFQNEKYILSDFTKQDMNIYELYSSYATNRLQEIINNKKPLE